MSIPTPVVIDISEWQAPSSINYDKLAKAIDAVIIRVQYGSNYVDKHYKTHIAEFKKRGIPIAVYAWVRGSSLSDMENEAKDFYARAKAYDPAFWWLDVEEKSMGDMRNGVEKYRAKLKALGAKKVGVYVANHLFSSFNLNLAPFDGVWVPTYGSNNGQYNGSNPTATSNYDIHQYTSQGKRDGYSGPLDLNRIVRKDLAYFFGKTSTSNKPAPKPAQPETNNTLGGLEMYIYWQPQAKGNVSDAYAVWGNKRFYLPTQARVNHFKNLVKDMTGKECREYRWARGSDQIKNAEASTDLSK